ncbi:MAG TPA: glycosyltransferase family 9 protein [Longimicrobiales bacterium]|nr:glycosyltransferase family 9 protein [Longimicrobiales bacterium]
MADVFTLARPPREIGIVMLSALGDAVHVLPVVNALKRKWPEARITWVIQPVPHQLVRSHEAVDDFIIFQRRRGAQALSSYRELRHAFQGRRFDLLINLQVYLKAGLITALAPADIKLGFDRKRARDMNWLFTNQRIPARPMQHVQDQYFEFIEYLGVDPAPIEWRLQITPEERAVQSRFFEPLGRTCAIVVGTSKPIKNWAPNRYARVIDALEGEFGLRTMLVGGPSEFERDLAERIMQTARIKPINTLGNDIRRLLYLLDGAALVISPDTGPLHVARALDKPVIGLYGYTNPKRYGPYRKFTDLVVDGYALDESDDYPLNMEYRPDGMTRVTVSAVLDKVRLALTKYLRAG